AVQRVAPAPGPRNFITTRSARTDGDMAWTAGAFVHYGYRPFEIRRCPAGGCDGAAAAVQQDFRVVENLVTGDLMGSFTPLPRLQLGGRLPVTWARGHGTEATEDGGLDRKSTRLNSSHVKISYAVFCLKKKTKQESK